MAIFYRLFFGVLLLCASLGVTSVQAATYQAIFTGKASGTDPQGALGGAAAIPETALQIMLEWDLSGPTSVVNTVSAVDASHIYNFGAYPTRMSINVGGVTLVAADPSIVPFQSFNMTSNVSNSLADYNGPNDQLYVQQASVTIASSLFHGWSFNVTQDLFKQGVISKGQTPPVDPTWDEYNRIHTQGGNALDLANLVLLGTLSGQSGITLNIEINSLTSRLKSGPADVPVPGAAVLMMSGLAAMGAIKKRRQKQAR
jgi:hypothetical protein